MASEKTDTTMQVDAALAVVVPGSPVKRSLDNGDVAESNKTGVTPSNAPSAAVQADGDDAEHRQKRAKTDADAAPPAKRERIQGIAMIKEE